MCHLRVRYHASMHPCIQHQAYLLVPLSLLPSLLPGGSWPSLPFSLLPWPFSLFGALPSLLVGPSPSAPSLQRAHKRKGQSMEAHLQKNRTACEAS